MTAEPPVVRCILCGQINKINEKILIQKRIYFTRTVRFRGLWKWTNLHLLHKGLFKGVLGKYNHILNVHSFLWLTWHSIPQPCSNGGPHCGVYKAAGTTETLSLHLHTSPRQTRIHLETKNITSLQLSPKGSWIQHHLWVFVENLQSKGSIPNKSHNANYMGKQHII